MRILVIKFVSVAAIALFFASCHSEVPTLPYPEDVEKYKWCGYQSEGYGVCKSNYEISDADCTAIGGTLFEDKRSCNLACKNCK